MGRVLYKALNQITSYYKKGVHNGVDVVKKWNKSCYITSHSDGEVLECVKGVPHDPGSTGNRSYGNYVKIRHNDGYMTLYAHLKNVKVIKGEKVFLLTNKKPYIMPNTYNWSSADIIAFCKLIGLSYELDGYGKVKETNIPEGSEIDLNNKITIRLSKD